MTAVIVVRLKGLVKISNQLSMTSSGWYYPIHFFPVALCLWHTLQNKKKA